MPGKIFSASYKIPCEEMTLLSIISDISDDLSSSTSFFVTSGPVVHHIM